MLVYMRLKRQMYRTMLLALAAPHQWQPAVSRSAIVVLKVGGLN
jgi:hypothetical protein